MLIVFSPCSPPAIMVIVVLAFKQVFSKVNIIISPKESETQINDDEDYKRILPICDNIFSRILLIGLNVFAV
jgi:hypothetical protein